MTLFQTEDYKGFVNEWIRSQPKEGRGVFRKIAEELRIHPTLVSHIFKGDKHLTLEQAASLTKFLNLKSLEIDYFIGLVELARAGSEELRRILLGRTKELQARALKLGQRIPKNKDLDDYGKSIFYSSWHYSALRLLTSLQKFQTKESLSDAFDLPKSKLEDAFDFLLEYGLIQRTEKNRVELGPAITHLDADSPFIKRHHTNWRLKTIEKYDQMKPNDLAFSAPLTLSKKDAAQFREELVLLIQSLAETVKESDAEELYCFNIDWLNITPKP